LCGAKKLLREWIGAVYTPVMLQRSTAARKSGPTRRNGAATAPVVMNERTETMAEKADVKKIAAEGAAQAQKIVTEGAAQARQAMEKSMEQITKGAEGIMKAAEDAAEFGRGNMEAFAKAAQTWAVGTQDLARQAMALAQGLTDHTLEGAKALAAVKSLNEAAEVQAKFAKAAMEKAVAESAKMQEAVFKLTEQAVAPISARMTAAMEKFGKPLAA
jgi:phasin family protein